MTSESGKPDWRLPYRSPLPVQRRRWAVALRIAVYAVVAAALIGTLVQFQSSAMKYLRRAEKFDRMYPSWRPTDAGANRPKAAKGAIGRWRVAVEEFWAGKNVYAFNPVDSRTRLHPNMPFVLVFLTPFARLPQWAMVLSWNVLKVVAAVAAILMAAAVVNHRDRRMPDWVIALALVAALPLIANDMQHGNTNCLVMAAIVLHLWLYRRGRDHASGWALAAAICLKMTPALFLLYWVFQRGWKVLIGAAVALVVLGVVLPVGACVAVKDYSVSDGVGHYAELTKTWVNKLILPGLVRGVWYPEHINQSLPGVMSRYFLAGENGDIYWNPEEPGGHEKSGWITLGGLAMTPAGLKHVVRIVQLVIVCLSAWAIGWRVLPRDDGRRALHYGLVVLGMMLLNQRTWDHHAAVLLVANVAIWYAVAFGRMGRGRRWVVFWLVMAAWVCLWAFRGGTFRAAAHLLGRDENTGETWGDLAQAYGQMFFHFVAMFTATILLSLGLKRTDDPYAEERQRLRRKEF